MPQPIIHIGYPTTGTNWFVKYFYPKIKNANVAYYSNIHFDSSDEKDSFEVKFNKPVDENEQQIIIAHALSGLVDFKWEKGKNRKFFLRKLKSNFPDASIVIFIRSQLDFILSGYSSYLKRGGTYRFSKLFSSDPDIYNNFIPLEYFNYVDLIESYKEQFGSENVHVFVYEDFLENNRSFIENYIKQLSLNVDINSLTFAKPNKKLRIGLASFVRHTNKFFSKGPKPKSNIFNFPCFYSLINKNLECLNKYSIWGKRISQKKVMGKDLIDFYNDYYKISNNQLIDKHHLDSIKKYNYPI